MILALVFRTGLVSLLRRLRSADLSTRVLEFGDSPIDRGKAPKLPPRRRVRPTTAKAAASPKWDKPATLFWLANDLMWIQDMLFRAAPRDKIITGLKHSRQHASDLGPSASFAAIELTRLIDYFEGGPEGIPMPLILDQVPHLANQIELVKRDIASRVEESQPQFKKLRVV
jgi:hypothetical protein